MPSIFPRRRVASSSTRSISRHRAADHDANPRGMVLERRRDVLGHQLKLHLRLAQVAVGAHVRGTSTPRRGGGSSRGGGRGERAGRGRRGARSTATPRRGGGRSARDRVSARDREARGTHPAHAAFTHALGSNPASSNASSEMDISAGPTRARQKWRGGRVLERARRSNTSRGPAIISSAAFHIACSLKCIEKPNHGLINQEIARLLIASRRHRETLGEPRQRTDVHIIAARRRCRRSRTPPRLPSRRAHLAGTSRVPRPSARLAGARPRPSPRARCRARRLTRMPVVLRRSSRDRSSPPAASPAPRSRAPARVVVPSRPRTTSTTPPRSPRARTRSTTPPRLPPIPSTRTRSSRRCSPPSRTTTAAATSPTSSARRRTRASRGSSASARRRSPERWRTRRSSATTT